MEKDFSKVKLPNFDFSNQNLSGSNFSDADLVGCNFNNSDLSYANFERANLVKASFQQSRLYHTNFKDARLGFSKFEPRDIFGCTFTLDCETFDSMEMSQNGIVMVLYFMLMTKLSEETRKRIRQAIIDEVGQAKFDTLGRAFAHRRL